MFTGIVQAVGRVSAVQPQGADVRLRIASADLDLRQAAIGDSIAVSGVCLTVVELPGDGFWADVSAETLRCTRAGAWQVGSRVNLEPALTPSTRLGGHFVSGHVDGLATVEQIQSEGRSQVFRLAAPDALARYIAAKGSVCLDGVSLTVNTVTGSVFSVNIVPHTLAVTTLGDWRAGQAVHLEVDLLARYLERLLHGPQTDVETGISRAFLARHGFAPEG